MALKSFLSTPANQSLFSSSPAILFVRKDSVYKTLHLDVWDAERNALNFSGSSPVVAHPPCRAWGRLRKFARPRPGERALSIFAIRQVRKNGGVLEHPVGSSLWKRAGLPAPGKFDKYGGWTLGVDQLWWGHKATKATLLYICGVNPREIPAIPFSLDYPSHVVQSKKSALPHISKADREHTPVKFATWLVDLASRCEVNHV